MYIYIDTFVYVQMYDMYVCLCVCVFVCEFSKSLFSALLARSGAVRLKFNHFAFAQAIGRTPSPSA